MKKQAKFVVFKGFDWYFRLVAANGEVILQSEGYTRRVDCVDTIQTIQEIAPGAKIVAGKREE